jgi:hypothetical protein
MQPCLNNSGQINWPNEGGALGKHEKSKGKHQDCCPSCPGWPKLPENAHTVSRPSKMARTYENAAGPSTGQSFRQASGPPKYRVLFIQDPAWRKSKEEAESGNEIIWTRTRIEEARWFELLQTGGSEGFMYKDMVTGNNGESLVNPLLEGYINVHIDEWVICYVCYGWGVIAAY